jgi:Spy/CpxP family protein refolding chaperone
MKKLPLSLLAAAPLALSLPAFAAQAPAKTNPPAAPSGPMVDQPLFGAHQHGAPSTEETPEQRARLQAANKLDDAKMKKLAIYEHQIAKGTPLRDALKASKLTLSEADQLSFLTRSYYRARMAARDAEAELKTLKSKLDANRAAGRQSDQKDLSRAVLLNRQLQEHARFRDGFLAKCSEPTRKLINSYEDEFVGIVREGQALETKNAAEAKAAALKGFNEDRLSRFLTYLQASAKQAPRSEALKKAGLEKKTADGLSLLLAEYYNKKMIYEADQKSLGETRARIAEAKSAKKQPSAFDERLETYYVDKMKGWGAFRSEFVKQNGSLLPDLLDKRSGEFVDVYKKARATIEAE